LHPPAEDLLGAADRRQVAAERVRVGGVEERDALVRGERVARVLLRTRSIAD
jgi:hypothetical protein